MTDAMGAGAKHYLVTGGCGFIGSHLCAQLIARGHRVTVLDDLSTGRQESLADGAQLVTGSVLDGALVEMLMQQVDGCFHLAAVASVARATEAWVECHRINLTGAVHIFNAARAKKIPVVYASSAAVYGANDALPLNENVTTYPLSAYGADKLACELHGQVATGLFGVPTLGLRLFNVYGPGQRLDSMYSGVISVFVHKVLNREPVEIHGDGSQTRDFIYVGDVCAHFIAGMVALHQLTPLPVALNVCTGHAVSVLALAETIMQAADEKVKITFGPNRPGDIPASLGDAALARRHLGLAAETGLLEGLARTIAAIRHAA